MIKKNGPGEAEAYTAEGSSEKTNSNRKGMGFCYLNGGLNPLGQAAAAGWRLLVKVLALRRW